MRSNDNGLFAGYVTQIFGADIDYAMSAGLRLSQSSPALPPAWSRQRCLRHIGMSGGAPAGEMLSLAAKPARS